MHHHPQQHTQMHIHPHTHTFTLGRSHPPVSQHVMLVRPFGADVHKVCVAARYRSWTMTMLKLIVVTSDPRHNAPYKDATHVRQSGTASAPAVFAVYTRHRATFPPAFPLAGPTHVGRPPRRCVSNYADAECCSPSMFHPMPNETWAP